VLGGWRLGRRPGLDGVRAIAVLLVIVAHAQKALTGETSLAGSTGVMVFFALSGFLITSIVFEGQDFVTFYRHRFLRLAPALVVFVAIAAAVQQALTGLPMWHAWPTLLYLANWMQVPPWFGHLWTLAVEEQFYLLGPVLLVVSRRWRHGPLVLCLGGMVLSLALKLALWDGGAGASRLYAGSDTEAWALLSGCLLAVLAHRGLPRLRRPGFATAGALCLFSLCLVHTSPAAAALAVPLAVPVFAGLLIWAACSASNRLLESAVLRHIGVRSYALYLWHPVCLTLSVLKSGPTMAALAFGLGLSWAAAEASWWLVESPFLRLRSRTPRSTPVDEDPRPSRLHWPVEVRTSTSAAVTYEPPARSPRETAARPRVQSPGALAPQPAYQHGGVAHRRRVVDQAT
jgi:peptidoglycan/LPS O-acetylase OafA/YrhL